MKLELNMSYTKIIKPKENEGIYSINWNDNEYIYPDGSGYPVKINIGKTICFETKNSAILDFIKWVDEIWVPFINEYTHHNKTISQEKFNEWDKKCINFEKAISAETGYNFKTTENEYTNEYTIDCVLVNDSIYWEFGD